MMRGPEPKQAPLKMIENIASEITKDFKVRMTRKEPSKILCEEDDELEIYELFVSDVSVETVIKMNLAMAKKLAENNSKIKITPLFILDK